MCCNCRENYGIDVSNIIINRHSIRNNMHALDNIGYPNILLRVLSVYNHMNCAELICRMEGIDLPALVTTFMILINRMNYMEQKICTYQIKRLWH